MVESIQLFRLSSTAVRGEGFELWKFFFKLFPPLESSFGPLFNSTLLVLNRLSFCVSFTITILFEVLVPNERTLSNLKVDTLVTKWHSLGNSYPFPAETIGVARLGRHNFIAIREFERVFCKYTFKYMVASGGTARQETEGALQ